MTAIVNAYRFAIACRSVVDSGTVQAGEQGGQPFLACHCRKANTGAACRPLHLALEPALETLPNNPARDGKCNASQNIVLL